MNHPNQFQETAAGIYENPEDATEVLVYYAPFDMHMLIATFLCTMVTQQSFKRYDAVTLVGEFCIWAKDHEVQHG